ncbi:MAG: hypothetical protein J2P15_18815, partial [Micromonosporaceae bacterium]|nr:hypothetical protein [Micromonosporaceae bacterium]
MPTQSGPHDAVFRRILGEPVNAASQLRAVLPGAMVNRFLLDDLTRLDEQALRARPLTPPVRMTLLLLKIAAGNARLAEDLRKWSDDLRAILVRPGGV